MFISYLDDIDCSSYEDTWGSILLYIDELISVNVGGIVLLQDAAVVPSALESGQTLELHDSNLHCGLYDTFSFAYLQDPFAKHLNL